jgi:iron complex outermembrane receptor protein
MKKLRSARFLRLFALIVLFAPLLASAATGVIAGRVTNAGSGNALGKARVSVKDTDLVVLTDDFGGYRLIDVPAGRREVEYFYTDLDPQVALVEVPAGGVATRDIALTSRVRYGDGNSQVVRMDRFTVGSDRETDARAIATNEQRFAPNLKNVMATDELGDVLGSNVGEFLKFIPGLAMEYSEVEIVGVSVRGIGGSMTAFTSDGASMVSANASPGRTFNMNTLALNNISRIEVTKVPTPATPADSLAGAVNLVTKSAFERPRARLNYGITLMANSENLTFRKTPHTLGDQPTRKLLAGWEFDYTLPVNRDFGIVVTGMRSDKFNEQHLSTTLFNAGGTGTGATFARPYLQQYTVQDGPRSQSRSNFGLKADWRATAHGVLSFNAQINAYKTYIGTQTWSFNAGTVATPNPASGIPFRFSETETAGATGRGAVTLSGGGQTFLGGTDQFGLRYRHDDGRWKIDAVTSLSLSDRSRPNPGHFGGITATLNGTPRVSLRDLVLDRPRIIEVFGTGERPVDPYDLANYSLTTATEQPYNNRSDHRSAQLSARRRFGFLPFPASLELGGARSTLKVDARVQTITWTYAGPDGNPATPDPASPFQMQSYRGQDSFYGFTNVPWISVNRAYDRLDHFVRTPANLVAAEQSRITGSEVLRETVTAAYAQAEARLWRNRLTVLGGARFERTDDSGRGPLVDLAAVFVRNPNGTFARNAAGQRIRRAEAGTAGSMEELRLVRKERAYAVTRSYDGLYPSLHLTLDATERLLLRAAYARTYGRPDLIDVIPNAQFAENDLNEQDQNNPAVVKGTITVRNTALRPWTADNFDLSAEYYTDGGGIISAGVFRKQISNFFGTQVRLADATLLEDLGLDAVYTGWNVSSKFNSGDARISGGEMNFRHSLRQLGRWGAPFTLFANATWLRLEGNRQADFTSFIPRTGNWGFSANWRQLGFVARWNHRGLDKRTAMPAVGTNAFQYIGARTTLDLNASWQLTKSLSLVGSASNVLNVPQTLLRYGDETPAYARQNRTSEFGIALALGLKGSF